MKYRSRIKYTVFENHNAYSFSGTSFRINIFNSKNKSEVEPFQIPDQKTSATRDLLVALFDNMYLAVVVVVFREQVHGVQQFVNIDKRA